MEIGNIKFKAKSIYNGEWVYGDLLHKTDGTHIYIGKGESGHILCPRVNPSSVCQFTGLKDCEGKEVWEGDIIKSPYTSEENTIEWNDHLCCFNTVDKIHESRYYLEKVIKELEWYVIGNKFDNK